MPNSRVERALAKATDTDAVIVEPGALARVEPALSAHFASRRALLVADRNT